MKKGLLKKTSAVVLAGVMAVSLVPVMGTVTDGTIGQVVAKAANSGTCGENVTWTLDNNGVLTITGSGQMENYTVAADSPFFENTDIKKVVIYDGVTNIGDYAFYNCINLTSVNVPNGVESIGEQALQGCNSLNTIIIPNGVTDIKRGAFTGCSSLANINIPNGVESIEENAFEGCDSLTSINIPSSVTYIGWGAFFSCNSLASIVVDSENTVYDSRDNCNALIESATNMLMQGCNNTKIPEGITSIEQMAFWDCTNLTSITIPNSVTDIGERVFYNCENLTSITVNSGNAIYDSRDNCNAIIETATDTLVCGCKNTKIPKSIMSIGEYAFCGCSGLTSIIIPNGVTNIEMEAFGDCSSLTSISLPSSIVSIGRWSFVNCENLAKVNISEGVTSIGGCAFDGCKNLKSVIVPNSVTNIGGGAFGYYYYAFDRKMDDFTIISHEGTAAETYAKDNGFTFQVAGGIRFKDVTDQTAFYFAPVGWAVDNNITTGWPDETFRPWNTCNRAAVVTFLWRMAGKPEPKKIAGFKDMPADEAKNQDFRKAISWAVEEGITTGWTDNTFRPWQTCNRAAIMTFIWRYADKPAATKPSSFKDKTGTADFDAAIAWASENGISTGYSDGTFGPWKDCNRASVAAFLYRYANE